MIAGIELGGTKTVVAVGREDGTLKEEWRFPTTTPEETFDQVTRWLAARGVPSAIGVAAFGPVAVSPGSERYGHVLDTPKEGWSGFGITSALADAFPAAAVTIETDVNAAALAEARLGVARGYDDVVYITIGTGIGAGILSGGHLIHGALHPECGHFKVPRHPDDSFPGVCPFHGDCLEGMASGPAIEGRWETPASDLPPDHPAWDIEAWYIAHGVLALLAVIAPSRVIIGGGVSQASGFHERVERLLKEKAAGYFPILREGPYILPPDLGQQAGIRGALLLACG